MILFGYCFSFVHTSTCALAKYTHAKIKDRVSSHWLNVAINFLTCQLQFQPVLHWHAVNSVLRFCDMDKQCLDLCMQTRLPLLMNNEN